MLEDRLGKRSLGLANRSDFPANQLCPRKDSSRSLSGLRCAAAITGFVCTDRRANPLAHPSPQPRTAWLVLPIAFGQSIPPPIRRRCRWQLRSATATGEWLRELSGDGEVAKLFKRRDIAGCAGKARAEPGGLVQAVRSRGVVYQRRRKDGKIPPRGANRADRAQQCRRNGGAIGSRAEVLAHCEEVQFKSINASTAAATCAERVCSTDLAMLITPALFSCAI